MMFKSLKSKFVSWKLRKKRSKQLDAEPTAIDEMSVCVSDSMQDTMEEIGDAVHYYFLNPKKLSYDFAYEMTVEDIIFPVSTESKMELAC